MNQELFPFEHAAFAAKVDRAVAVLREFGPGGYVAYSGGKDSDVIRHLAARAGLNLPTVYHVTTVDPPEVVRHCREAGAVFDHPGTSYCKEIVTRGLPTRWRRWCCEVLKHGRPAPGPVVIGVRAAESAARAKRWKEITVDRTLGFIICPIVGWSDSDVWRYLEENSVKTCSLYAEGFKRLGCVGCPLSRGSRIRDFARWPAIARNIKAAFDKSTACPGSDKAQFWHDWVNDVHGERADECLGALEFWG